MIGITILWGIFATVFFILAVYHFWMAKKPITNFEIIQVSGRGSGIIAGGVSVFRVIDQVQENIHTFVNTFNSANRKINLIASGGYYIACLTSIMSFNLTVIH